MRNQEDFHYYAEEVLRMHVLPLLERKGKQYTDGQDCFLNFKEGAEFNVTTPENDLLTKASKHWMALSLWARGKAPTPPKKYDLYERCMDLIVYLLLLMYMIHCNAHMSKTIMGTIHPANQSEPLP